MKIEKIYIEGYRNLKKYSTEFDPKINFIYGENAQGKTNLIEAIWMFTGARSFRGTKDADLVNFDGQEFLWRKIFDCSVEKKENIFLFVH